MLSAAWVRGRAYETHEEPVVETAEAEAAVGVATPDELKSDPSESGNLSDPQTRECELSDFRVWVFRGK